MEKNGDVDKTFVKISIVVLNCCGKTPRRQQDYRCIYLNGIDIGNMAAQIVFFTATMIIAVLAKAIKSAFEKRFAKPRLIVESPQSAIEARLVRLMVK